MATEASRLGPVIGGREAGKFAKGRGIETVGDLLAFWPRRYRTRESDFGRLTVGEYLVGVGEVKSAETRPMKARRGSLFTAVITDGESELDVTFFRPYGHVGKLVPGARAIFAGTVGSFRGRLQLTHPGYTLLDDFDRGERKDLIPFYLPVGGLPTWTVTECVTVALHSLEEATEVLPADVLARRGLLSRIQALAAVHNPDSWADVVAGRRRLSFEEAFVLQTVLARRRRERELVLTAARTPRVGGLLAAFDDRMPFVLTSAQTVAGEEIAADMARPTPMHRLLQGEVGSGKTLVALRAMLAAIDSGGQAALLAPTEVLAAQHHRSICDLLGDLAQGGLLGGSDIGTRVALLTGSQSAASRKKALLDVVSGDAGIVVGTHALIQSTVEFRDLALVVVDEQHRFGVEQRDALRAKGIHPPHTLVMTATPIPRTVAMTVFGDLETTTMRELPTGRAPITTHVVPAGRPGWLDRVWLRVAEQVADGRQVYVVCPRIGEDDPLDLEDFLAGGGVPDIPDEEGADGEQGSGIPARPVAGVYAVFAELRADPVLARATIGVLHGRLSAEDRDEVMRRFTQGRIDVLVSTTVIEVGVDVPNASVMVVRDADRFGVSQLHQLRGRIGRGEHAGLCFLVHDSDIEATVHRLDAVAATTDGFELARLDLATRREGDILGASQSGRRSQLEFLHVLTDEEVIEQAREDATAVVAADPELLDHPALAAAVRGRVDAEHAAYLERG